jgi:hypothetical protein
VTAPVSHWLLGSAFLSNYVWMIDGDFIGFEVHAAVTVKSSAVWDVTSCKLQTFQKTMQPPYSGCKSKPRKTLAATRAVFSLKICLF